MVGESAAVAAKARTAADAAGAMVDCADLITSVLEPRMMAARAFLEAFTRKPSTFHLAVARLPGTWRLVVRLVAGQTTFATSRKNGQSAWHLPCSGGACDEASFARLGWQRADVDDLNLRGTAIRDGQVPAESRQRKVER